MQLTNTLKLLASRLEDLETCNNRINKHGQMLQKVLSEIETYESSEDLLQKVKSVNERATLFRIASATMINVSNKADSLAALRFNFA